jgi:hypothetical protein
MPTATLLLLLLQVLENAVCDSEKRSKQLLEDALTAQKYEREARKTLASAREAQASAERALQQQTQRLMTAERMRLSDLKVGLFVGLLSVWRAGSTCLSLSSCKAAGLLVRIYAVLGLLFLVGNAFLWSGNSNSRAMCCCLLTCVPLLLQEQQSLEKRLALAQQECSNLRDALLNRGSNSSCSWQQQLGLVPAGQAQPPVGVTWSPTAFGSAGLAAACAAVSSGLVGNSPGNWALCAPQQTAPTPDGPGSVLNGYTGAVGHGAHGQIGSPVRSSVGAAGGSWAIGAAAAGAKEVHGLSPSKQQQPLGQGQAVPAPHMQNKQQQQQQLWQVPAADAGHTGADVAAHSAATITRYQAKLAQLRAMKEQLLRKTYSDLAEPPASLSADVEANQQQQEQQEPPPQHKQQQQQAESMPPATAFVSTPRSAQEDWLIGAGSAGGVMLSARSSIDPSNGVSAGGVSSTGNGAVRSSSGGGSHLSAWSMPGDTAGTGAVEGGIASKLAGDCQLSQLGTSIQKARTAAAAAAGVHQPGVKTEAGAGSPQHKQEQSMVGAGGINALLTAVAGSGHSSAGLKAAAVGCVVGKTSAKVHRRPSKEGSGQASLLGTSRTTTAKEQLQVHHTIAAAAGLGVGGASHGLSSRSNLQRWAQPLMHEQQQQQQQSMPLRQHSGAVGSRRPTSSGRSSLA